MSEDIQFFQKEVSKLRQGGGDPVCDPWMGTGTTGVSACSLGRRFVGFDIFGEYVEIAERRIRDAVASRRLPGTDARDSG